MRLIRAMFVLFYCLYPTFSKSAEINFNQVKKIYYLLAESKGHSQSSFGHAYLRLGLKDKPSSSDYVIEFVADIQASKLNYAKAMGIGTPYNRAIIIKKYSEIIPEMNYISNRDLTSYEITLNEEEKQQFLSTLSMHLENGKMGHYSFFKRNCAEAIVTLMNDTGITIKGIRKIIPTAFPEILRKINRLGDISIDHSLSNRRILLVKKYQETLKAVLHEMGSPLTLSDLSSEDVSLRVSSFYELLENLNKREDKKNLKSYLSAFTFLENNLLRQELQEKMGEKEQLQSNLSLRTVVIFPGARDIQIGKKEFVIQNNELFIQFEITGKKIIRGNIEIIKKINKVKLHDTEIKNQSYLYYKDQLLGMIVPKTWDKNGFIPTHSWIIAKSSFKDNQITVDLLISTYRISTNEIKTPGKEHEISLKNSLKDMPMCYGIVDVQKILLERVIFASEKKALTKEANFALFKDLMNGNIIIVPGYSDIQSWTSSLDQKLISQIIYQKHLSQYGTFWNATKVYFKQNDADLESLLALSEMAKKGIYGSIFFKTKNNIGHAILVTGLKRKSADEFYIEAFDPNLPTAFTKTVFTYNTAKNTIHSFLYGESNIYILTPKVELDFYYNKLINNKESKEFILMISKLTNRYSFSVKELSNIY